MLSSDALQSSAQSLWKRGLPTDYTHASAREAGFSGADCATPKGSTPPPVIVEKPAVQEPKINADAIAAKVANLLSEKLDGLRHEMATVNARLASRQDYDRWLRHNVEDVLEKVEQMNAFLLEDRFGGRAM